MKNKWPSFEELMNLAEQSPEALEKLRNDEIERVIERAPESMKRRLRGLQFQIDCQRRLHKTPLSSCIAISKMMRDSLVQLNSVLHGNLDHDIELANKVDPGKVIPFAGNFAS